MKKITNNDIINVAPTKFIGTTVQVASFSLLPWKAFVIKQLQEVCSFILQITVIKERVMKEIGKRVQT